ncbi:MAG: GNAT family N-acetyltransferase [Phycisphaeraceae bacterium]|nr:GNAT family N-acetyltransferase [Phycisphaeraceae bacterium]MCW5753381.1 GNAT family N-acetyltransferase [Phycisphaeraceae bacterium]
MTHPKSHPVPYIPADWSGVVALIGQCYTEYGLSLNLDDACEQHLRDPGAYFRDSGGEFWVVRDAEGQVRATAALAVHHELQPMRGELKSMYVHPDWRRRGWGARLTKLVIETARDKGCSIMELWSDTRFLAAHALYRSLGFTPIGERVIEDSNASREYGFVLSLDPRNDDVASPLEDVKTS